MFKKIAYLMFAVLISGIGIGEVFVLNAATVDTDSDGIYDDGDNSGIVGDNPCTGGNTLSCDDNCVYAYNPDQADADGDGIGNACEDNGIDFSLASDSRILIESADLPNIANTEFTIEAWVKSKAASATGGIFSYFNLNLVGIQMWAEDNVPKLEMKPSVGWNSPTSTVESGGAILLDTWYHLAGMLTNSSHNHPASKSCTSTVMAETPHLDIYVNGEFKNCATTGASFIEPYEPIDELYIGRDPGTGTFDGVIDEIRFWTVARTEAEIQQCMNYELGTLLGCSIDSSILKGYWRFDVGTGTLVTDSSGNGYSGTIEINGTPWDGGWVNGYPFSYIDTDSDGDGYTILAGDCNDDDASVYPGATEICDGKDNDCNLSTPDGYIESWYGTLCDGPDSDSCIEGIYVCIDAVQTCTDDTGDDIEICDGIDNDCNGQTDEDLFQTTTCGLGACSGNTGIETCDAGSWNNNTCDPFAGASTEVCDDIDNDCNGIVDDDLINETRCGVGACAGNTGDITCIAGSWVNNTCDPLEGATTEVPNNGIDDDCNSLTYDTPPDVDGDGDGYSEIQGDCDDTNAAVNPGATEIPGNGIDDDCNFLTYDTPIDTDSDGDGYTDLQGDCDDTNAAVNPAATEVPLNGIDDDCNPLTYDSPLYTDDDGDGYAEVPLIEVVATNSLEIENLSATEDTILLENQGDCDDTNAAVNPAATEVPLNGIDDDCNPLTYDSPLDTDDDRDGYSENEGDCDDSNPAVNPAAVEVPGNGTDDDCNPATLDGDMDADSIPDDGDLSGIAGDNPCTGGNTLNCDDNCIYTWNPDQADTDNDGVGNICDNCSQTDNSGQQDTDSDGYGNKCDCDLDNNNFVGPNDFYLFGKAWWSDPNSPNWNPDADFDSDSFVGPNDFNIFRTRWWTNAPWE